MVGMLINAGVIVLGGLLGLLFHKLIPERVSVLVLKALAICVMVLGLDMALDSQNFIIVILSIAIGAILGEFLRIEDGFEKLAGSVSKRFDKGGGASGGKAGRSKLAT